MNLRLLTASIVAAVAFGPAAHAAVVITALPQPLNLHDDFFGSNEPIDVDGNGSVDFTIGYNFWFVGARTELANRLVYIPSPPPNIGGGVASLQMPFLIQSTLDSSDFGWTSSDPLGGYVSPNENAFAEIIFVTSTGSATRFNGRGAIGVEFHSAVGIHYGYLDIDAGPGYAGITLYGWAYESQHGVPIFAGQVPEPSVLILAGIATLSFLSCRRRK